MKTKHYLPIVITLAAVAVQNLAADTFVMKSGVKYEGKILSQDAKTYLIEVRVTPTIKDHRRIVKNQVKEIIKEAADAQDFARVKTLVPTPDHLPEQAYTGRIKRVKYFLTKFPQSTHLKEVNTILQTLQKELQIISQGGIKLGGKLISPSDVKINAYDIHARILLHEMKALASKGLYRAALRKWENLKNNHTHAYAYKDSISLASQTLRAHASELKRLLATLEIRKAKRQSAIASLDPDDRERTVELLAERKKAYEALIEKEQKQLLTRWLSIDPFHKKPMDNNLRNAESDLNAIASYDPSQFKPAGPTFRGAWLSLTEGDLKKADQLIQTLQSFRLPAKYTTPLTKQLAKKRALQERDKKAEERRVEEERIKKAKAAREEAEKEAENRKKGKKTRVQPRKR